MKKLIMNFSNSKIKMEKLKFLFVGRGPGEVSQARALAKYIAEKGGKIIFAVHQKSNLFFLSEDKSKNFKIFLTENPDSLKKLVESENPDVLLLFNSKMWGNLFHNNPGFKKPKLSLCVDSNWLFNNKKYFPNFQAIQWVDHYLVLFSKKIFELGLKKYKGDFTIPQEFLKRIIPVGFIPSYQKPKKKDLLEIRKKMGIKNDEKFIFSYFSGLGAGHRIFAFENLISAVDKLVEKGRKIKVLYIGPTADLAQNKLERKWLIKREKLEASEYFLTLASADLVFQHQGMVTLSQAISVQVPVIANVHILKGKPIPYLHFFEVRPFFKAGACQMFSKTTPLSKIGKITEQLLYDKEIRKKMRIAQKAIFEKGEEKAYKIIQKLICAN